MHKQEKRGERYKTVDLITEYNHFMWECNHLAHRPSLHRSPQNKRNVGICWAKSLTGFKLDATRPTSCNIIQHGVQPNMLAQHVAFVYTGRKRTSLTTSDFLETFRFDYEYEFDYEYDFLETFRFDYEYEFDYNFSVRPNSWPAGVRKVVVWSNLVAVLLFIKWVAEDPAVNITSSKAKKSNLYSLSNLKVASGTVVVVNVTCTAPLWL